MDLYQELSLFQKSLKEYKRLLAQLQLNQPIPDAYQNKRESLLLDSSRLVSQITRLTGKDESLVIYEFGKPQTVNMWEMGLRNEYDYRTVEAIDACIDNTIKAIGKLRTEGESWEALKRSKRVTAKNLFKDWGKLDLIGTPEMIVARIKDAIEQVNSEGYQSRIHVETGDMPDFTPVGQVSSYHCTIFGGSTDAEEEVGYITLQPLPKEHTLFKLKYLPSWGLFFTHFLKQLFAEFQRLGFIHFEGKKPPIGFRLPHRGKNDH